MSTLTDMQAAVATFEAKVASLVTQSGYLVDVVTGPASGADSSVDVGTRTIKTVARVLDEIVLTHTWNAIGAYDAGTTYAKGDLVNDISGIAYVSRIASNIGNTPSTSPTQWFQLFDNSKQLIGYSTDLNLWGAPAQIQNVHDSAPWAFADWTFSADSGGSLIYLTKSRATAFGSHAIVHGSDQLGGIFFGGDDGVTYDNASAAIQVVVDGSPSAGNVSGQILFQTAPDGTSGAFGLVNRFTIGGNGKLLFANAVDYPNDWLTLFQLSVGRAYGFAQITQASILTIDAMPDAFLAGAQTGEFTDVGNAIAITGIAVSNNTSHVTGAFGGYVEAYRMPGTLGGACGFEFDTINFAALVEIDPFTQNSEQTVGLQIAAGADLTGTQYPTSAAINIRDNSSTFQAGIIFGNDAIEGTNGTDGNIGAAIQMATGHAIDYYYAAGDVSWQLYAGIGIDGDYHFATSGAGYLSAPNLKFGTFVGTPGSITGYITIKDSAGNTRKLAVTS